MVPILEIIGHVAITLIAVVGLALRTERRLTRIETDVTWLKLNIGSACKGDSDNEQNNDMDQT